MSDPLTFDATISLGSILNLIAFLLGGVGVYVKLEKRIVRIETVLELTTAVRMSREPRRHGDPTPD
jgi:hypothetical protein